MTARREEPGEPVRRDERERSWAPAVEESERPAPLMIRDQSEAFRSRWMDVQTNFVDEPRQAVKDADELVEAVMRRLVEGFKNERATLEEQWTRNEEVSTEDLRLLLQRYRSFFDRLLDVRAI